MTPIKPTFTNTGPNYKKSSTGWGILILILLLVPGAIWWWNAYKRDFIKDKMVQTVHEKSMGLYKLAYDDLILDEMAGSLSIKNLSLRFDSTRLFGMILEGQAPAFLINIRIPEMNVRGVITPQALIKNELIGRILEVKDPLIEIIHTGMGKDSSRYSPTQEVYKQILGSLELISIDTVVASGANISNSWLRSEKFSVRVNNVSVSMIDVKVDSASNADPNRYLFARQIKMECANMSWASTNKLYDFNISGFSLNSERGTAGIREFSIHPVLGEAAFAKMFITQKDRFNLVTKNIHLVNLNLKNLLENKLVADSMIVSTPQFRLYRDLTMKRDLKNRLDKNLQSLLNELPMSIYLGKIIIQNGYLEYKLIGEKTQQPGKLQFYNLYTTIGNFTNETQMIEKNKVLAVDMKARFLNQSTVRLNWRFYLGRPDGTFDLKGTLGAMDAYHLNPISRPLAAVEFIKGRINGLQFDFSGNIYGMEGQVQLAYDDLKIKVWKLDEDSQELKKDALTQLAANILVRNSNAKKKGELKIEQVNYKRDPTRSFLGMSWKAVLSGIKQTMGVK